jgi:hypothetical protein
MTPEEFESNMAVTDEIPVESPTPAPEVQEEVVESPAPEVQEEVVEAAVNTTAASGRGYTTAPVDSDPATRWPKGQPVKGHIYGFICPATGHLMAAMLMDTWEDVDNTIRELKARKAVAEFDLANARQHMLQQSERPKLIVTERMDPAQR